MRKVKQKISFLLVIVLLVNLLLPCASALAAESSNDFVVPGGNEQNLISPDTSNWGNQTSIPQSNANPSIKNSNMEEAIVNQIIEDREGQILPLLASITIRLARQYIVRTLTIARVIITSHASTRIVQNSISSLQLQKVMDNGAKYVDKYSEARAIYNNQQNIICIFTQVSGKWVMTTVYKPGFGEISKKFIRSNWSF
ncbi:hypothetical protein Dtox_1824 [Desulfofarcimen acetoxidans DSM 771]|uniref:DUF4878 domain-containing protein n=1 Tax=Desulfofarcimen acetoxidans (strain ATCC 49208 / DSM 771 / KCTC 5769 / VKM B-1644 / 5575) TaxID=485916 RepID=C8VXL8_DESAS|nr:DUF4258 domain-containing protein [Desulfofarcimen acetoxidans]ACV62674.1 hypothetical protein Dtox_1824 [Desulfofarcimen acetoxidans DSM 771]